MLIEEAKDKELLACSTTTGTNQNRHVGVHHDRFQKKYDEYRVHAQTAQRP